MSVYFIAHTNKKGSGAACAKVSASNVDAALARFVKRYPLRDRVPTVVGMKGVEDGGMRVNVR